MSTVMVMEKKELAFLLSCMEVRQYFGLALEQPGKEQIPELLTGMYRKGWLKNDGIRISVCSKVSEIAAKIAEAGKVLYGFWADERIPLCCVYPGKRPLIMQEAVGRKNCILLQWAAREQIEDILQEAGIVCAGRISEESLRGIGSEMLPGKLMSRRELKAYPEISLLMERINCQNGVFEKQFCIWREGLYDYLIEQDMETEKVRKVSLSDGLLQHLWEKADL